VTSILEAPWSKRGFVVRQGTQKPVNRLRIRPAARIGTVLACLMVIAVSTAAEDRDGPTQTRGARLRPFLETGVFVGEQSDALIWSQGKAVECAGLLYRNLLSFNVLWRIRDYEADLHWNLLHRRESGVKVARVAR
jgi:hypothetical protein